MRNEDRNVTRGSGSGVIRTEDGEERPIRAGDFLLILPEEYHQFRNTSDSEVLRFIFMVPKERE
ncbi:MAG: cupin domain-containing protein [Spirochaetaceae bacterium]